MAETSQETNQYVDKKQIVTDKYTADIFLDKKFGSIKISLDVRNIRGVRLVVDELLKEAGYDLPTGLTAEIKGEEFSSATLSPLIREGENTLKLESQVESSKAEVDTDTNINALTVEVEAVPLVTDLSEKDLQALYTLTLGKINSNGLDTCERSKLMQISKDIRSGDRSLLDCSHEIQDIANAIDKILND